MPFSPPKGSPWAQSQESFSSEGVPDFLSATSSSLPEHTLTEIRHVVGLLQELECFLQSLASQILVSATGRSPAPGMEHVLGCCLHSLLYGAEQEDTVLGCSFLLCHRHRAGKSRSGAIDLGLAQVSLCSLPLLSSLFFCCIPNPRGISP